MNCIKCGEKPWNDRASLCQSCMDALLERNIDTPAEKMF